MAKPIKAFLGKSYTKNGVTKTYMLDIRTNRYGWFNVGESATEYGRGLFKEYEETVEKTFSGRTKASILRENIKTVIDKVSDSNIEGMDELKDAMYDKLNAMSDYEINNFSDGNEKYINLYFEYKNSTDTGVDARIISLAKSLNIDIYDYIESENIPDKVKFTLQNINDYVKMDKEFDIDDEIEDIALGRKNV